MTDFSKKRVLVTGASSGTGVGIAKAFAKLGATVVISARRENRLKAVQRDIQAAGGRAEVQVADLSSREGARDLARRCGEIDILINNAALTTMKYQSVRVRDDPFWDETFTTGLWAPLALMQELSPGMVKRGNGVILNISSISGQRGTAYLAPYAAMKAALDMMSRVAAMEYAAERSGVRCNSIAFGFIDTEGLAKNAGDRDGAVQIAEQLSPLGRMVTVEEVAALCVFMSTDEAAPILGTVINIDGGLVTGMYSFAGKFQDAQDVPDIL
jgi:NAD(P)-dependent dehydrogenase (short-subunit alcohol dehydrogenase family)